MDNSVLFQKILFAIIPFLMQRFAKEVHIHFPNLTTMTTNKAGYF